jgi:hypothetical protein
MKKKIKIFTLTGPANWCSFDPESQNSSSRYRELHNPAQALMETKSKKKKIQVLITESLIIKPKPWCKPKNMKKKIKLFTIIGSAT